MRGVAPGLQAQSGLAVAADALVPAPVRHYTQGLLAAVPLTHLVAASLAAGAAATGATQQGVARAWTATLGAGLFGALGVVVLGVVLAGER